jgi:hypothetical protein
MVKRSLLAKCLLDIGKGYCAIDPQGRIVVFHEAPFSGKTLHFTGMAVTVLCVPG